MAAIWYELHKLNASTAALQITLAEVAEKAGFTSEKINGMIIEGTIVGIESRLQQIEAQAGGMISALLWELAEAEEWD